VKALFCCQIEERWRDKALDSDQELDAFPIRALSSSILRVRVEAASMMRVMEAERKEKASMEVTG